MSRRVHLVGIGGAGLSAIARVLFERGEEVTGSDKAVSVYSEELESLGIPVSYGHQAANVEGANLVIASSAIPESNVELLRAGDIGIPVMRREQFLPELLIGKDVIAIAGTHGKTTTTGLIAWLLTAVGRDPGYIVGGIIRDLGRNAHSGEGVEFVIEADEYDQTFLGLNPRVALVTNVEFDHPDCYPSLKEFTSAFQAFVDRVEDKVIVCSDDPGSSSLSIRNAERWTYGLKHPAEWCAGNIQTNSIGGSDFVLLHQGKQLGLMKTRLPGWHNVANVVGAFAVLHALGIMPEMVQSALAEFHGMGRRFEQIGQSSGVVVVDDYAHHPTEIKATLEAARKRFDSQTIWAVFQPHTYSRMRALADDLQHAFDAADHVLILEVFAAREELDPDFMGNQIAKRINHQDVRFIPTIEEAVELLYQAVTPGSVVITLSAGDGNQVGYDLLTRLGFAAEEELNE
jgi:UDP-N-acetylmuramate--alanine ligase